MSKEFAQKVMDAIAKPGKSADPGDRVQRVMALCEEELAKQDPEKPASDPSALGRRNR